MGGKQRFRMQGRGYLVLVFGLVAVPVILASAAYACQRLTTATASPNSGPVGTTVTVTGGNYSASATASNVEVHLDTRDGLVLGSTRAASNGTFSVSFQIPSNVTVGYHTLIATQYTSAGAPVAGSPGRTTLRVTSPSVAQASTLDPAALTGPVGVGAVGLAAATALVTVHRRRRAAASAA